MMNTFNLPTILHVDDDENDRLLLNIAHYRAKVPARLIGLNDGREAVAYLQGEGVYRDRERTPVPDLVLLDLKLPLKSGFEVMEWIRAQVTLQYMPVVVLSSSQSEADKRRAFRLGANFYIVKPVTIPAMMEMLKQLHTQWLAQTVPLFGCA